MTVFGVNPASDSAHDDYVELFGFPFKLISDKGSEIAARFGAVKEDGKKILRSVFIIQDGIVRFAKEGYPTSDDLLGSLAPAN